jgi:hypothetical protein
MTSATRLSAWPGTVPSEAVDPAFAANATRVSGIGSTRARPRPISRLLRLMVWRNGLLRQASRMTRRSRRADSIAFSTRASEMVSSSTSKSRASLASTGIK